MTDDPITYSDVLELEYAYAKAKAVLDQIEYKDGYPSYPREVASLMHSLAQGKWENKAYDPRKTQEQIENIDTADLHVCTSILTSCSRRERFVDGHWKQVLQGDTLDKVIARLKVLKANGT